jgi:hypothetical protein
MSSPQPIKSSTPARPSFTLLEACTACQDVTLALIPAEPLLIAMESFLNAMIRAEPLLQLGNPTPSVA